MCTLDRIRYNLLCGDIHILAFGVQKPITFLPVFFFTHYDNSFNLYYAHLLKHIGHDPRTWHACVSQSVTITVVVSILLLRYGE